MLRYKLRTLMIVLALGAPVLAGVAWLAAAFLRTEDDLLKHYGGGPTAVSHPDLKLIEALQSGDQDSN
jgi:hypothetical protein